MPGRKPIPTQLKVLKGTDQPCRINKAEPKPNDDDIKQPPTLSARAKKYWRQMLPMLQQAKMITNADAAAFAVLCEICGAYFYASSMVAKRGMVVKSKTGAPVQSPYFRAMLQSSDQMRKWFTEFGMTPASRTRVSSTPGESKNPFDF